jgi:hypothetical protein
MTATLKAVATRIAYSIIWVIYWSAIAYAVLVALYIAADAIKWVGSFDKHNHQGDIASNPVPSVDNPLYLTCKGTRTQTSERGLLDHGPELLSIAIDRKRAIVTVEGRYPEKLLNPEDQEVWIFGSGPAVNGHIYIGNINRITGQTTIGVPLTRTLFWNFDGVCRVTTEKAIP